MRRQLARLRTMARGWWRRNVIDDAAPFTDDDAERYRHRR